jgi:5-methylcytosine-specific restriction endonuclease McrA
MTKQQLHSYLLVQARALDKNEWLIIDALQQAQRCELYRDFGQASLKLYGVNILEMSDARASMFSWIARSALKFQMLQLALKNRQITVSKAAKIVGSLTKETEEHWVEIAKTQTSREIEKEVAKAKGRAKKITIETTPERLEKWQRTQSVVSQKKRKFVGKEEVFDAVIDDYLYRHDPVEKAKRARPAKAQPTSDMTAASVHAVNGRDQCQCTWIDGQGRRCPNDRNVHIHHIKPLSEGGTNDIENLTTLCATHHDMIHQMNFTIDNAPIANWGGIHFPGNTFCRSMRSPIKHDLHLLSGTEAEGQSGKS